MRLTLTLKANEIEAFFLKNIMEANDWRFDYSRYCSEEETQYIFTKWQDEIDEYKDYSDSGYLQIEDK